ncbi:MAG: hypothetical protein LBE50_04690 [Gallionellaceae bacterium]|jgi:hypothetical protein|nr:hypothetical protein [Gallionellaceae bacterium]
MDKNNWFETIRRYVAMISCAIGNGLFWSIWVTGGARLLFDLQGKTAWLFIGLPVAVFIAVAILRWKRLPEALGFDKRN